MYSSMGRSLTQGGDSVDAGPDDGRSLGGSVLLALGLSLGALLQPQLLSLLGLRPVLVQQLESLGGCTNNAGY